jgi:hypothetical protein
MLNLQTLRTKAEEAADEFLDCALQEGCQPRAAADYSLAAKNATAMVLTCIQADATERKGQRESMRR